MAVPAFAEIFIKISARPKSRISSNYGRADLDARLRFADRLQRFAGRRPSAARTRRRWAMDGSQYRPRYRFRHLPEKCRETRRRRTFFCRIRAEVSLALRAAQ